jgi:16S rRNA processing protein RimM
MRIAVGRIIKPHGIKGEVKVLPETFDVDRFYELNGVMLELRGEEKSYEIDGIRITSDGKILLHFEGVDDRNAADLLRNAVITVSPEETLELPVDTYYYFQLEGMVVYDRRQQKEIGIIKEIIDTAADDIYIVKDADKEYLIPARKEFIKLVDLEENRMEIESIPGLLDL